MSTPCQSGACLTPILEGVSDLAEGSSLPDDAPRLRVDALAILGGVEIKHDEYPTYFTTPSRKVDGAGPRFVLAVSVMWGYGGAESLARKGAAVAIRVLVVEDHDLFAEAIGSLLMDAGMDVVGSLRTGAAAFPFLEDQVADVVVLDIGLREEGGLRIGERILDRWPGMRIIALGPLEDERAAYEAIQIGFHAFVTKDTPSDDFVRIVRAIARGEPVPPLRSSVDKRIDLTGRLHNLTARERNVLGLLVEETDNRAIADRLNMTKAEVRSDIQNLLEKLGVHSRLEAIRAAVSEAPDPRIDHLHLTPMTDDQILAHLRFMHAHGIASLSPVDFDNMRELHTQLHEQPPPSPA